MATCASGTRGLSRSRIAGARSLSAGGSLPGIVNGYAVELGLTHASQQGLHERVLALAAGIRLHRRDEILRVEPGKAWHSGTLADAALAVTGRASDDLVTPSLFVGFDRVGEVIRILPGQR